MSETRTPLACATLAEIESALTKYCDLVRASNLTVSTKGIYISQATNFVRWLRGEFNPGANKTRTPRTGLRGGWRGKAMAAKGAL